MSQGERRGSELKKAWAVVKRSVGSAWLVLEEASSKPLVLKSSLCAWIVAAVAEDFPLGSALQLSPLCCTVQAGPRVQSWTSASQTIERPVARFNATKLDVLCL